MDLWIDQAQSAYGLCAEPSYDAADPKGETYPLNNLLIQAISLTSESANSSSRPAPADSPSTRLFLKAHAELPSIRFLPNGFVSETSPEVVSLSTPDGETLLLVINENRISYVLTRRNN